ncbi:MAG TPA: serine/threonine protein kinase [Gammaproteobacteria bacterium]|nr:serine/threonine protein kinase [Gammaproteobacteria bacterium]
MSDAAAAPFSGLTPERLLAAVEGIGYRCDGRLLAMNSYENRVYQVGLEEDAPIIAKFYRPARWTDAAILEEHAFTKELAELEIPVVPPCRDAGVITLHHYEELRFALYPRQAGRAPELDNDDTLMWLGRFIGRIHRAGASRAYVHRPRLTIENFGEQPSRFLLEQRFLPEDLRPAYESIARDLLAAVRGRFAQTQDVQWLRLHGDCHPGNILWTDAGPHFVDFDDSLTGPAMQDLWMLLSGDPDAMSRQLSKILEGYIEFMEFNPAELRLIEALRSLRMIHYAGWIARRWHDPAFPMAFPWFNTQRYWQDHILSLREQLSALDEPPLEVHRSF